MSMAGSSASSTTSAPALLHSMAVTPTSPAGSMQLIAYCHAIACGMMSGPSCARGAGVHPASNITSAAAAAPLR